MECVICNSKIIPDPDGWDGGHNAEPIAKGRCCGDCNHIVTVKRLNDFQSRKEIEKRRAESKRPVDEEPMSNCCTASFTYPGWPDSDFCNECHEHAGVDEDE